MVLFALCTVLRMAKLSEQPDFILIIGVRFRTFSGGSLNRYEPQGLCTESMSFFVSFGWIIDSGYYSIMVEKPIREQVSEQETAKVNNINHEKILKTFDN